MKSVARELGVAQGSVFGVLLLPEGWAQALSLLLALGRRERWVVLTEESLAREVGG